MMRGRTSTYLSPHLTSRLHFPIPPPPSPFSTPLGTILAKKGNLLPCPLYVSQLSENFTYIYSASSSQKVAYQPAASIHFCLPVSLVILTSTVLVFQENDAVVRACTVSTVENLIIPAAFATILEISALTCWLRLCWCVGRGEERFRG